MANNNPGHPELQRIIEDRIEKAVNQEHKLHDSQAPDHQLTETRQFRGHR